ncbi:MULTISPECIES: hypothetical protein [unclassified Amycolatopsis]
MTSSASPRTCRTSAELTSNDLPHRVDEHGDLLAGLHGTRMAVPGR